MSSKNLTKFLIFTLFTIVTQRGIAQNFISGNLAVDRVTTNPVATLTDAATPVFIDQYPTSAGAAIGTATAFLNSSSSLPSANPFYLLQSGTAASEGLISLDTTASYVCVAGYNALTGASGVASASDKQIIGKVSLARVNSTAGNCGTALAGNNYRSLASDGTGFWFSGANGIVYANSSTATSGTLITDNNTDAVVIFAGSLYVSTQKTKYTSGKIGIQAFTGLPTSSTSTTTGIITSSTSSNVSAPYAFSFSKDGKTCYVADGANGILKFTGTGSTYPLTYTFNYILTSTGTKVPAEGIAVDYSSSNPVVYFTTLNPGGSNGNGGNLIEKVVDAGSGNQTPTLIATAASKNAFNGLSFTPTTITASPVSIGICNGTNAVFSITMNACAANTNYSYQWQQFNGTSWANIGATGYTPTSTATGGSVGTNTNTLTVASNASGYTNGTQYRCVVTYMGKYILTSSAATLTINTPPTSASLSGTTSVCSGVSTNLAVAITGGKSPFSIVYTGGSGGSLTNYVSGTSIPVSSTGTVTYSLTSVTDANGCAVASLSSSGTATVTITAPYTWNGSPTSTDWSTASNWSCSTLPTSTSDVIISSSAASFPVLSAGVTVNSIQLQSPSTLTLNGNTLVINGAVSGTGTIKGSATSSLTLNGTTGSIYFATGSDTLENLTLGSNASATLGTTLNITSWTKTPGTVNIGNGATLNTNDVLTLQSNDSCTAMITAIPEDAITGASLGFINGKVTVDRYIHSDVAKPGVYENGNGNTSINNGLRAWRLLTAPITQSGSETIQAAWQNGGAPYTPGQGIGTIVTGPVAANGLDLVSGVSLLSWDIASQGFLPMTSTLGAISNGNYGGANAGNTGYMLFVRGDRNPASVSNPYDGGININNTTLEPKGNLITGRQSYSVMPSTGPLLSQASFTLIGNPYPAPIDFTAITNNNVRKQYYIWNPNLNTVGGFVMLDVNTSLLLSSPNTGLETQYLQSSQAFFAIGMSGTGDALTFDESNKNNSNNNFVFRPASPTAPPFISDLYLLDTAGNTWLADGNLAQYDNSYSADVDYLDALKLSNANENFSLIRNGVKLALERRPIIGNTDTLFFNLTQTTQRAYQFRFTANQLGRSGLMGFLKDSYTGDSTLLNLYGTTSVNFIVDGNPASKNANRFMIVFETMAAAAAPLPVVFTSIKASEQNAVIPVSWTVQNEADIKSYVVQKSTDGKTFIDVATVTAKGLLQYNWTDVNPVIADNYYRIKTAGNNGEIQFSQTVDVKINKEHSGIAVYPNPVKDSRIGLQFTNMPAGIYKLRLVNTIGQVLFTTSVNYSAGSAAQSIQLDNSIAKGVYTLEIIKDDQRLSSIDVYYQ